MQINFKLNLRYIISCLIFVLVSCNSGNKQQESNKQLFQGKFKLSAKANIDTMDIDWTIDNVNSDDINATLKDMGWHLATMTVSLVESSTQPTPVEGLLAGIYPSPSINVGQKIEIKDINCKNAIFSKAGDTCSAYFKLSYDISKGTDNQVLFPVQIAPKGDISRVLSFTAAVKPYESIANYRAVNSFEHLYYSGAQVVANKRAYQILLIQNSSLKPINITELSTLTNPNFTFMHRNVALDNNDPYYGNEPECSVAANPNQGQVSNLPNLNDSCIIIYKAPLDSSKYHETDVIKINTDAKHFYPSWANKYNLIANYINGTPLPDLPINQILGGFSEPLPFKSFKIIYNFTPKKLPIYRGSTRNRIIVDLDKWSAVLYKGAIILTNVGSAVLISGDEEFPYGSILGNGNILVRACGGAWAFANAVAKAVSGKVAFYFNINSNGSCGNEYKLDDNWVMPENGYFNKQIYAINQTGCGNSGDNWDIGGYVTLSGGCSEDRCKYTIPVTAHHGGAPGQCQDTQTNSFELSFVKPTSNWIMNLDAPSADPISFAAVGGQYSRGDIGSKITQVTQSSITCDNNSGICTTVDIHTSEEASQSGTYSVNLVTGDIFNNGIIQFTRSTGYDLENFNLKVNNQ